jgi:hypothetical protein
MSGWTIKMGVSGQKPLLRFLNRSQFFMYKIKKLKIPLDADKFFNIFDQLTLS